MDVFSPLLTGLTIASPSFLVAAGLTLSLGAAGTFTVCHGSFAMLGAYLAWSIFARIPHDPVALVAGTLAATAAIATLGAALDVLLRRLSRTLRLLLTLGVFLVVQDAVPLVWGTAPLPFSRPSSDFVLTVIGPLSLAALLLVLHRTRWGSLVRAAAHDPAMLRALGVDPRWVLTGVAALAAGLAGLAGALAVPEAASGLDLAFLTDAIAVTIVGGVGSITGAYLAALAIGLLQAFGVDLFPSASPFLAVAAVAVILAVRPRGLLGGRRIPAPMEAILIRPAPLSARLLFVAALLAAIAAPLVAGEAILSLLIQAPIAILFAAGLHTLMGPGGMPSLGHAAFFGIGAYAGVSLVHNAGADMGLAMLAAPLAAGLAALIAGAAIVRLPGIPLAMLTLVFAQTVWTLAVQAGAGLIVGRPDWATPAIFYWLTLGLCIGATLLLRRTLYAPFGYALRALRDNPVRAAAIGLPAYVLRLSAFTLAGTSAGLAGSLNAFARGSVSPADFSLAKSAGALVAVLFGGIQTISGPLVGALAGSAADVGLPATAIWHLGLGLALIALVLLLPEGIAGVSLRAWRRAR